MQYRAEQVGSLLRPPELSQARTRGLPSMLRETENRSILDALAKQGQIGIDILTDGEMRRASWLHNMTVAVEGFVPHKIMLDWKGPGAATEESHAPPPARNCGKFGN